MSGSGAHKRSQHLAISDNVKPSALSLAHLIAKLVGIEKDKVNVRIELGKRLLSLGEM